MCFECLNHLDTQKHPNVLNVFHRQKESLTVVCVLAVGYIFISALVIFNVEPETFNNFLMLYIGLQYL